MFSSPVGDALNSKKERKYNSVCIYIYTLVKAARVRHVLAMRKKIVIRICGAQQYFGPAPFIRWGPKAQTEEGYGPDSVMQVQHSTGIQPRTIQSSASPKSPRKKG